MSALKLGELCAGYGGLGLAVEEALGAELAWYSEFDAAPSAIMATHWPDIPNHGDMTLIDWAAVEPVDIISGGTPCQDLSAAGRRKGMTEGTRSNLWVNMREAIATIKPKYVAWENVRGAYSAGADSDLEFCPGCMGADGGAREHVLRALGRVLGDLSDLGYDTQWRGLRAADVGAPHGRFRVFVLATRRDAAHPNDFRLERISTGRRGAEFTPTAGRGSTVADAPSAALGEHSGEPFAEEAWTPGGDGSSDPRGERHADHRREAAAESASIGRREGWAEHAGQQGRPDAIERGASTEWGEYAPAIRRWEAVRGTAPAPTELTAKGKHRLSARFAEWMMGIPAGWVTDVDISRNEQLKAIGNGVVPQQALAAFQDMLAEPLEEKVAA